MLRKQTPGRTDVLKLTSAGKTIKKCIGVSGNDSELCIPLLLLQKVSLASSWEVCWTYTSRFVLASC